MTLSPDDHPEALVHAALGEVPKLSRDPSLRAFCGAYLSAGSSEQEARAALESVWPGLSRVPTAKVWAMMEEDGKRSLAATTPGYGPGIDALRMYKECMTMKGWQ